MPTRAVVPSIPAGSDRCYAHYDRPATDFPDGRPMCSQCAKKYWESFYGEDDSDLRFAIVREVTQLLKDEAVQRKRAAEDARKHTRKRPRRKSSVVSKHEQRLSWTCGSLDLGGKTTSFS